MVLSRGTKGTFFSVNFSWGIGVTLGCYWAGGISGERKSDQFRVIYMLAANLVLLFEIYMYMWQYHTGEMRVREMVENTLYFFILGV
jgi:hypothetical protein